MKIAITGSTGLVGSRIQELLAKNFEFLQVHQQDADITNKNALWSFLKDEDFDLFFHLAAYTNVDGAEVEKETAYKINVEGTKNIFEICQKKNAKMIYTSTDFVFDGVNPPFFEDSPPNPIGYYGQTKYEGEKVVENNAMIVRLSYPYRASFEPKKDFARTIKSLLEQGKELEMVEDSLMTPTFIDDIAFTLKHLFVNFSPEIFHIVGSDSLSPYEAGLLIAKTSQLNESLIKPTTYGKYFKDKAKRPRYSNIKTKKNNFYKMRGFEEGLKVMYH